VIKSLMIASLALVFTPQAEAGNGHAKPHPTTTTTSSPTTTTAPSTTTTTPPQPGNICPTGDPGTRKAAFMGFANGYRYGQLSAADRIRYMDEFAASGAKWFRMNLENWSLAEAQDVVAKARERGFCVIGNLNANPSGTHWANPPDHQKWADAAVSTFVKPLINDVTVWEIWNEPNLSGFFNGTSDNYADLLHTAYVTIHAAQPWAVISTAGLAPAGNGTNPNNAVPYWTRVYNWNAREGRSGSVGLFDVMAHHAYLYPEDPTDHANDQDWNGFYQAKLIHNVMVSKGDGAKKVWGTETGAPSGCTYAQCITIDDAARRISGVMDRWTIEWGSFTGPLMFHELQEQPGVTGIEHYFGFMRSDWSHKEPLWTAYKNYAGT
jgi:polysaccharide biosynthesis protein PslG